MVMLHSPMPPLDLDHVHRVAHLARLKLTDEQARDARDRLDAVLGYMRCLGELDLEGVEPMPHVADNRLDADEPGPTLAPETLRDLAPDTWGPFIRVPKVIDGGSSA